MEERIAAEESPFERRGREGFSLIEALIAIVIAAILAVALVRLAGNTRMNAAKVRQLVEMMTLNESLLVQIGNQEVGITEGRTGDLAWRTIVEPVEFSAVARFSVDNKRDEKRSPANGRGLAIQADSRPSTKAPTTQESPQWIPLHVTIVVQSPSGHRYTSDTITLGPATRDR
jgi:prepilin-type N-terminal cleavage/methylation domain-containing protein